MSVKAYSSEKRWKPFSKAICNELNVQSLLTRINTTNPSSHLLWVLLKLITSQISIALRRREYDLLLLVLLVVYTV